MKLQLAIVAYYVHKHLFMFWLHAPYLAPQKYLMYITYFLIKFRNNKTDKSCLFWSIFMELWNHSLWTTSARGGEKNYSHMRIYNNVYNSFEELKELSDCFVFRYRPAIYFLSRASHTQCKKGKKYSKSWRHLCDNGVQLITSAGYCDVQYLAVTLISFPPDRAAYCLQFRWLNVYLSRD